MLRFNKMSLLLGAGIILGVGCVVLSGCSSQPSSSGGGTPTNSPGGMPGRGGGGGFAAMFQAHRNAFQLMRFLGNIAKLDAGAKDNLTPAQAKSILGIIQPLRQKPTLEEADAKTALDGIQKILTPAQLNDIKSFPAPQRFGGGRPGGMPGGGMRPGGPPPVGMAGGPPPTGMGGGMKGGGGRPMMGGGPPRNFNPLNPPKGMPARPGRVDINKLIQDLTTKSGGK